MNVIISIDPKEISDKMLKNMKFKNYEILRIVHQKKKLSSSSLHIEVNNIFHDEKKTSNKFLVIALKKIEETISGEKISFFEAYSKKLQSDGLVLKDVSVIQMDIEEKISEEKLYSFLNGIFSKYSPNTM